MSKPKNKKQNESSDNTGKQFLDSPVDTPEDSSRRNLLKGAGLIGAAVAGSSGTIIAQESNPSETSAQELEALEVLTAVEAEVLEALCDVLIPSDENGPGASEARAAHYIDRALSAHNKEYREDYFVSLNAINEHAQRTYNNSFARLQRSQQNSLIAALQNDDIAGCSPGSAAFFSLVRSHTIDGTFCDPYYGGNRDFVGWDLLRYPGVRLGVSPEEVAAGAALAPTHQSAYENNSYTKQPANSASSGATGASDD